MKACELCGIELNEEECIFASYETEIEGKKVLICCAQCAKKVE